MKPSSFKQYHQFVTDSIDNLTTNQYITLMQTIIDHLPIVVITCVAIDYSSNKVRFAIGKVDGKCPFCDNQDKS